MNRYVRSSGVVQQGQQWAVAINGKLVERSIGNRDAAVAACLWWETNYRDESMNAEITAIDAARAFDSRYLGWTDAAIAADLRASGVVIPKDPEFIDEALGQGRR